MDTRLALSMLGDGWNIISPIWQNTEEEWHNCTWGDERPKPTWAELLVAWDQYQLVTGTDAAERAIRSALDGAMSTYTTYPVSEVDGWDALYREAQEWQDSGGTVVGPILTAYAANIGTVDGQPADTLPDYCAVVIAKHLAWGAKYGQELAVRRTRSKTLEAIVAGISATPPTHTLEDLATFTAGIAS